MALHYEAIHWLNYSNYEDLRFYEIGHQKCEPNYDYGPIIRDKFILHYVVKGKGRLEMDGQVFPVESNQAFVIPADVLSYYQADAAEPWEYIWLQFHGPKAVEILQKAGIKSRWEQCRSSRSIFKRSAKHKNLCSNLNTIQGM